MSLLIDELVTIGRLVLCGVGELVMDVGTMLDGQKAVKEKLIDQLGGVSDALDWLYREIERAE